MPVYQVTFYDKYQPADGEREEREFIQADPLNVLAGDAEEAIQKVRTSCVGHISEGNLDGEPYKERCIEVRITGVVELCCIDIDH